MVYTVRPATRADLDRILYLEHENFEPLTRASDKVVRGRFERYQKGFFVTKKWGLGEVGYIFIAPYRDIWETNGSTNSHEDLILPTQYIDPESDMVQFISIAVLPDHRVTNLRREGYQGSPPSELLMRAAVEHSMEIDADRIRVLAVTPQGNKILRGTGFDFIRELNIEGEEDGIALWGSDLTKDGKTLIESIKNYYLG
jgi:ribosomal protein S18 acetylase RimI-like enzyme